MHDLANTLQATLHYAGTPSTVAVDPTGLSVQGLVNPTFVVAIGEMAAASPNAQFTFALKECDTVGGSYTAVDGGDMVTDPNCVQPDDVASGVFVTVDTDNDSDVYRVTYKGIKEFVKVYITPVDEPSATPVTITLLAEPAQAPTTT